MRPFNVERCTAERSIKMDNFLDAITEYLYDIHANADIKIEEIAQDISSMHDTSIRDAEVNGWISVKDRLPR